LTWSASLEEGDGNLTHSISGAVMVAEMTPEGWTGPADIAVMDAGIASRPMIASDGQYAHLIYRTADPGVPVRLVYQRASLSTDLANTHSWSPSLRLSADEAYWAQLAVLPNGDLVVVFNQQTEGTISVDETVVRRTGIFVRRSTDQGLTWSAPIRLAHTDESVARTSLAASPDGSTLIVSWDEGYNNLTGVGEPRGLATSVSQDGGVTWAEPQRITGPVEQSVVATDGELAVLVYRRTTHDELLYRFSQDHGLSWSEPELVPDAVTRPYPGKHNFDKLSLAFDGDGRLLLAYVGADEDAPNGLSVMVTTFADGAWTEPVAVASPVGYAEYPRLTVTLGNVVQLVYFVRDKEFEVGSYTLWGVTGTSDAQGVAPVALEPVPLPMPTTVAVTPVVVRAHEEPPPAPAPLTEIDRQPSSPQSIVSEPVLRVIVVTSLALVAVTGLLVLAHVWRRYHV
jgi:hypothetical protein